MPKLSGFRDSGVPSPGPLSHPHKPGVLRYLPARSTASLSSLRQQTWPQLPTLFPWICRRAAPSAEFSVDRHRHLMSFLTMLGPSPDWNVGLSAEDLCTKDCGWVQKVVQDLIPWDAGTDSGVTYEVQELSLNLVRYITPKQ